MEQHNNTDCPVDEIGTRGPILTKEELGIFTGRECTGLGFIRTQKIPVTGGERIPLFTKETQCHDKTIIINERLLNISGFHVGQLNMLSTWVA